MADPPPPARAARSSTSLVLVANARMPSQRAQSMQVAQAAAAFARAGVATTLLYARRRGTAIPADATELWEYYAVPPGPSPAAEATRCVDWIDAVPRKVQYFPARMQEVSFARNAAKRVRTGFAGALVLSREIETAHKLRGRDGVFLEIHRVPGGRTRRRWLEQAGRHCAGVVAISAGVREDLVALGIAGSDVLVEHDAYEPALFTDLPSRADARAELGLPVDRPLVVYTGGLLAWKGVDVLVEAARRLDGPYFAIAGGMDADVEALRERASGLENVRVDGFQPPARVPLYLAAADLGVVPNRSTPAISARYTSPLKVFEAMAAGLPLVASDLPSLREILSEDEAYFVPPDDPGALAEGLRAALDDDAGRGRRAERMRARAGEHTWDARARRILGWMGARA